MESDFRFKASVLKQFWRWQRVVLFRDRKKIEEAYKEWLKENSQVADCPFNVISFMVGEGLVKDRTEIDFYERGE